MRDKMIQELHLYNYKCFADQKVSFKALTLLSGFNDTGKSSVIHQIVLETHSDHILNGIRVAVHDGKLAPDNVQIHFFQRQKDGQAQVLSPRIDRNGRIDQWPNGFFDEWDKNLELLLLPGNM